MTEGRPDPPGAHTRRAPPSQQAMWCYNPGTCLLARLKLNKLHCPIPGPWNCLVLFHVFSLSVCLNTI